MVKAGQFNKQIRITKERSDLSTRGELELNHKLEKCKCGGRAE